MSNAPVLSRPKERELLEKAKGGDEAARQELILANLRWVWRVAERYRGRGIPFADLFQLGVMGLMSAIRAYDLSKHVRMTTYATYWIKQYILLETERHSTIISLPRNAPRRSLKDPKAIEQIEAILQGIASMSAMGKSSDIGLRTGHSRGTLKNRPAFAEGLRVYDALGEAEERLQRIRDVRRSLRFLPQREKLVVWLRLRDWPHTKVAELLKITAEGSRKIEIRGRERMKALLKDYESK